MYARTLACDLARARVCEREDASVKLITKQPKKNRYNRRDGYNESLLIVPSDSLYATSAAILWKLVHLITLN